MAWSCNRHTSHLDSLYLHLYIQCIYMYITQCVPWLYRAEARVSFLITVLQSLLDCNFMCMQPYDCLHRFCLLEMKGEEKDSSLFILPNSWEYILATRTTRTHTLKVQKHSILQPIPNPMIDGGYKMAIASFPGSPSSFFFFLTLL